MRNHFYRHRRDDAVVVLHPMLAEMLRRHRKECSAIAARRGKGPVRDSDRVFRISSSLLRWLKLDAEFAGVGLTDARGRRTTVHDIRAGFNTTLRRNATDPALRMRLMRHKTADLTFGAYERSRSTNCAANSNVFRWQRHCVRQHATRP